MGTLIRMNSTQHISTLPDGQHASSIITSTDPITVITSALAYLHTRERETNRCAYIRAWRDELASAIDMVQEPLLSHFEQHAAERRDTLQQCYGLLHSSMARQDTCGIDAALGGILGMIQDSVPPDFAAFRWHSTRRQEALEF